MRLAAALFGLVLLVGGCSDPTGPEEVRLTAAQRRWESTRPASNSYTMQQRVLCFCVTGSSTFQVTVTSGSITRAVNLATGESLSVTLLTIFRTVDQLFTQGVEINFKRGKHRSITINFQGKNE